MNTQYFTTNNNQKFPLSTEALAFMQEQIKLAYGLTDLAGQNIIVRKPTSSVPGLVIYDGELLPLTGTVPTSAADISIACIAIAEQTETLSVEGQFEGNVRTTRSAYYANRNTSGVNKKNLSDFTTLKSISTLMTELTEAQRHTVPTGAIMMWSGTIANIPTGWALCNGQNGTPNLQGRFIVGATTSNVTFDGENYNYPVGTTGGKNKVALTIAQIPKHNHNTSSSTSDATISTDTKKSTPKFGGNDGGSATISDSYCFEIASGNGQNGNDIAASSLFTGHNHSFELKARGGKSDGTTDVHENRPVFYALAYIMKIV